MVAFLRLLSSLLLLTTLIACGPERRDDDDDIDKRPDAGDLLPDAGDDGPDGGDDGPDGGDEPDGGPDDTEAPVAQILSGPSGLVSSSSATFEFEADDVDATFGCQLDTEPAFDCESPITFTDLPDGAHVFFVRATDDAGNTQQEPASREWVVDTVAPDVSLTGTPEPVTTDRSATFSFASADPTATFECRLDAQPPAPCESPASWHELPSGRHRFVVVATDPAGNTTADAIEFVWTITSDDSVTLRFAAANITSGNYQSYDPGHGQRILQGLKPDIVLIQEFNYGNNSATDVGRWVAETFDSTFHWYREDGAQIPNGVISRYPILEAGKWEDGQAPNREFAWARIDVPGPRDLWAISVHLLTRNASTRNTESNQLVGYIREHVPEDDFLVIGGDFNTDSHSEAAYKTLGAVVVTSGPYPADQNGRTGTNASRGKPYDGVYVDRDLEAFEVPTVIGANSFPYGLVFDSRVYEPLADVAPVLRNDSGAPSMQHMAVVRDFSLPLD